MIALVPAVLRMAYLVSPLRSDQLRRDAMTSPTLVMALTTDERHELQLSHNEDKAMHWLQRP